MKRIDSSLSSVAHVTDFFFFPDFEKPADEEDVLAATGGGVDVTGDSLRAFAIDLRASWNGSIDDGWATLADSLFTVGTGAFLKLGSFGFGLGAEKKDESDFASLTEVTTCFASFLMSGTFIGSGGATANFLDGGAVFDEGTSPSFRFLLFASTVQEN